MDWIADRVIQLRKAAVSIYAVLLVVLGLSCSVLPVNYDMTDYLPESANSTQGLEILRTSFCENLPNAQVRDSVALVVQGQALKERIVQASGVEAVSWFDDVANVGIPVEYLDFDLVDSYYHEGKALYSVTITQGSEQEAVEAFKEIVGDDGALMGDAVSQASSQ